MTSWPIVATFAVWIAIVTYVTMNPTFTNVMVALAILVVALVAGAASDEFHL